MFIVPPIWVQNSLWLSFIVCLFPLFFCIAYWSVLRFKKRYIEHILHGGEAFEFYKRAHGFPADADVEPVIKSLFGHQYRILSYAIPIIVGAMAYAGCLMLFLLKVAPQHFGGPVAKIEVIPDAFFYGVAGAFLWGLYDLIRRFQEADLSPVCLCYITLRVFIVGVLSWVLPVVFRKELTPLIAFALGVFPVQELKSFLTWLVKIFLSARLGKMFPPIENDAKVVDHVSLLQGATKRTIEQLDRLCIESAAQLAQTDPVKLLVETNIDWDLILDLVDQAVLFMYIGAGMDKLRSMGIRCATELASLYDCDTRNRTEAIRKAVLLLEELDPHLSAASLESVGQTVFSSPQVCFIRCLRGEMNRGTRCKCLDRRSPRWPLRIRWVVAGKRK